MQLFIKGPAEFIKLTKAYKIPTYTSIAENFESNFKESLDYHLNEGSMASLEEKKKKYGETILFLNELEKTAIGNAKCLKDYKNATAGTLKSIESTYKWLNPEQGENELAFGENCPYSRLSNWVLEQSQDLNAVIEAIHKIEELIKVKEITGGSINAANLEIQKLAVGKKSLAAILNNKSKDDMIKAKQNLINELNSQIKAVDIIIPVVTSKLLNTEIPNIENKNLTSFDKEIKNFAEMSIKEFMDIKRKLVVTN